MTNLEKFNAEHAEIKSKIEIVRRNISSAQETLDRERTILDGYMKEEHELISKYSELAA